MPQPQEPTQEELAQFATNLMKYQKITETVTELQPYTNARKPCNDERKAITHVIALQRTTSQWNIALHTTNQHTRVRAMHAFAAQYKVIQTHMQTTQTVRVRNKMQQT